MSAVTIRTTCEVCGDVVLDETDVYLVVPRRRPRLLEWISGRGPVDSRYVFVHCDGIQSRPASARVEEILRVCGVDVLEV